VGKYRRFESPSARSSNSADFRLSGDRKVVDRSQSADKPFSIIVIALENLVSSCAKERRMDDNRIADIFDRLGLDTSKRDEFARFAQQGPLRIEPEQLADFRLDCSTLSDESSEED
jgi:hypothetical protein